MNAQENSKRVQYAEDLRRKVPTQQLLPGAYLDETALSAGYGISRPHCGTYFGGWSVRAASSFTRTGVPRWRP